MGDTFLEVTGETLRLCQVALIPRDALLQFLSKHPEAYPIVATQLGSQYQIACEQLPTMILDGDAMNEAMVGAEVPPDDGGEIV